MRNGAAEGLCHLARLSKMWSDRTTSKPNEGMGHLNSLKLELPGSALLSNVTVAALSAVGLTSLVGMSGGGERTLLVVMVLTALLSTVFVLRMRETVDRARRQGAGVGTVDPLTGVATAGSGEQVLGLEFAAAQRGRPLTVVLLRLEQLPKYRAVHGRAVGNQLLRVAGRALRRHRRAMHLVARHAGEEGMFLCILSGSNREGATVFASRVRRDLLHPKGVPAHAGVSVGIASFDASMSSPRDLLRQASFALEKGAASGGKVVVVGGGGGEGA